MRHSAAHCDATGTGWTSAVHQGSFPRYIQVYLGNITQVTQVQLTSNVPITYQINYSNDGSNWLTGDTVSVLA